MEMPGRGPLWKTAIAHALGASLGFPERPTALGKRYAFPTFPQRRRSFIFLTKQHRKDPKPSNPHHRPSGSSFDENMLRLDIIALTLG
jgi:hypothetical protein